MPQAILITGANRGIGLALTRNYVRQGAKVFAVCRQTSEALEQTGAQVIQDVDVASAEGLERLRVTLKGVQLDLLINNAGILRTDELGALDYSDVVQQLLVNALGPLRVTEALLANLTPGAKVAMITSRMGSMSDNSSGGYYGYRMSKAALNAASVSLARDLKGRGIAVALLHPGFVQTDMVNHAGDISAEEAAQRLIKRIEELTLESSGSFWHSNGERLEW